jgi:predicted acetyltransferase
MCQQVSLVQGPRTEASSMTEPEHGIDVTRVGEEHQALLENLLTLYIHDLSEFIDLEPQPDGRFVYPWLPLYWQEAHRLPFVVRVDGRLAGFVFVMRAVSVHGDDEVWDLAEFFILRGFRRRGVGASVAHEIWGRLRGRWEVRVREQNAPALAFWRTTVSAFTLSPATPEVVEEGEKRWEVFSFVSHDS